MAYPIDRKLVVAVSTTALFDLSLEDKIYKEEGVEKFKEYQISHRNTHLEKGLAFPFIRRFLNINKVYPDQKPVEVVMLSRNNPESGARVFNSIKDFDLDITRAVFTTGQQLRDRGNIVNCFAIVFSPYCSHFCSQQ
jgi:5'-nucleotidase